jgi:hypothetical protein
LDSVTHDAASDCSCEVANRGLHILGTGRKQHCISDDGLLLQDRRRALSIARSHNCPGYPHGIPTSTVIQHDDLAQVASQVHGRRETTRAGTDYDTVHLHVSAFAQAWCGSSERQLKSG